MLKNIDIICISSIDWDFIWQGHQEIMSTFAGNGNRVLFIENTGIRTPGFRDIKRLTKRLVNWFKSVRGFREESENLYIYSPIILPFPYSRVARHINRFILINPIKRWMKIMGFREPVIWTFLPTGIATDIINSIDYKLLVYYCIADFYELAGDAKKIKRTEDELIEKSDLIFAQGKALRDRCARLNDSVHIFPFGVKIEAFYDLDNSAAGRVPEDIKGIKHPIVGYVGGIHRHIDFGLVKFISGRHPEWSIVLVGPPQTDVSAISGLRNVYLLGKKDFSALPGYIRQFDACIIPYELNSYTATVFPTKLNEYHAAGKPVVSTDLPEIDNFNKENDGLVLVGKTYPDFVKRIEEALKDKNSELEKRRLASAKNNSWTVRIDKMSGLIEGSIEKKISLSLNWQERFLKFYRISRKKMLGITGALFAGYILLFHTPLIWFAAGPLNISQKPVKADCIAVFGGGVGESGKAGQGYEERVKYAVELYKKGYAPHIIFSTGYTYVFKETMIMRALAISLGVPDNAIVLEDKSSNTYENVKFTKDILDAQGWGKVLLVSSPYHMLRTALVFKKIAKDKMVTYTPLPESSFYSHGAFNIFERQVTIRQIRGILHEYLGIIYYWWNRRI